VAVAVHFLGVGSVGIGNEKTAAEHAFEVVGARGPSFAAQGLDERVKVGVGGDQSKFVLGAAFSGEIKRSGTVGAAAEELGVDVAEDQALAHPVHLSPNLRGMEFPPAESAAIHCEMQIGVLLPANGDDALDADGRWAVEMIRFESAADFVADRTRDELR